MSGPAEIVLYTTTFAATVKIRSDISKIKHILNSKKIPYEEVDLTELPHRRRDMLAHSDNNPVLPQLHVNNRFIGTVDELQEFEDWGELDAILRGVSPGKLAADAAAAFEAAAAAAAAETPVSPAPRFTLEEEEVEEEGEEESEQEIEIAVAAAAAVAAAGEEEENEAEEEADFSSEAQEGLDDEPEAAEDAAAASDSGDSGSGDTEDQGAAPEEHSCSFSVADTVEIEGEEEEQESPLKHAGKEEEVAAAPTPEREVAEQSPAQLIQSPISPLSDVDTEVPLDHHLHEASSSVEPEQEEQEEEVAAVAAEPPEDLESSDLPTPLKAHRLGEDLHAHPVEGDLFPSPEKRPQSGDSDISSVPDDGHIIL